MVSSTFLSIALSYGLLGLQAYASPIINLDSITALKPIREDDLSAGTLKLNSFQKRAIEDSMENAIELLPINEDEFVPNHLRKRSDDLSRLDLKEEVRMIYGGVCSKSQIYMANMTLQQPDADHPLIMMEKFDGLLKSVSCKKGSIAMDFNTKAAMDYAIKAWDWINEKDDDYFFLIANHKGCSEDAQRTPYRISKVDYDEKAFKTVLTTESISWDNLAANFDLSLGSANLSPRLSKRGLNSRDITKRGFWDIFSTFDFGKSVYWDLSVGDNFSRKTIYSDPFHQAKMLQMTCAGCYLSGGIEFSGYVRVERFSVKELRIGGKPKNLHAKLEVETVLAGAIPGGALKFEQTLFELGIPGLSIPGIFTLGPSLQYQVGFGLSSAGTANFTVGVATQIQNGAGLLADFMTPSNSGANGFDGSSIDPILSLNDISVSAAASVYAQPVLAFGVKNGFCPEKSRTITNGLRTTSGANIELWFKAAKFTGLPEIMPNIDRKLWGVRWPFMDLCFPIGEPHAAPLPVSQAPTLPNVGIAVAPSDKIDESNMMPVVAIDNVVTGFSTR
ncbi:hypothetical protein ABW20_dc0100443 [Dactylellina cionopaga]|nr:hypothetical protein ABW20_dc0100443 [Dactylellina cionopaga]